MTAGEAYLRIEGVTKRFGDFWALKGISLEIQEGEFVCFLGPSGCGKTTLLRVVAGLDAQSEGRLFQGGKEISALPPSGRDFGIVFQSYALFPNLSVARNVSYGLENRRLARAAIKTRVEELLALVGLGDQGRKYPAQLSGGQQQRVALARALATQPGLLLLDEPLSALDAKVRQHLRHEIRQLHERLRVTTIMVTHDQEEALTMADRIVVMNQGVVEQVGTPFEIYTQPSTAFVADFIGMMNFLPAVLSESGRAKLGALTVEVPKNGAGAGDRITLAIRPEDIVVPVESGSSFDNRLTAKLGSFEFLGTFVRAELILEGVEQPLQADLSRNQVRRLGLEEGQAIEVALPSARLTVFGSGG